MKIGNFHHAKFVSFPRKRESMIGREMDMDTRFPPSREQASRV